MVNWINDVVHVHSEFESPKNFWRWAAMAALSAVVKDNVYLNQGIFNLYPNIYVMFHADSGLKKGPPVNMAKKLVKEVGNTRVISGRSSIQGILRKLGTSESKPGGIVEKGSAAFICSSELSSSIVDDKAATDILTDLYDRSYNADDWGSLLKMEEFNLRSPVITMLTATNEAHSSSFFDRKDVAGGYFARTFIIYESEENRSNSLLVPPEREINYPQLANYLRDLSKLKGEFQPLGARQESEVHMISKVNPHTNVTEWFSPAGNRYEEWYMQFKKDLKHVKDTTGTLNRFGSSVLKVAMLLSLGEQPSLRISESAMEDAIEICEKLVGNARRVSVGKADGDVSDAGRKKILLQELMTREPHEITRAQLQKKYWMHGTITEWDEVALSFQAAEIIEIGVSGNNQIYKLTPKTLKELKDHFAGKMGKEE
jgi:hypothetical protein